MPRGVWLLLLGVLAAGLGVASARAAVGATTAGTATDTATTVTTSADTTSTATSTTSTTTSSTTATTTTAATTTPAYAPLTPSPLPAGCIGAGTAAISKPSRLTVALGTPAAALGSSAYPASGSVLTFESSTVGGSRCRFDEVTLNGVSLFGGAVTATSVQAKDGLGTTTGLTVNGVGVTADSGDTVRIDRWGALSLGATVGRVTAPLVLRLLERHDSLPAGTVIAVAFAAAARGTATPSSPHGGRDGAKAERHGKHAQSHRPPNFPATTTPLLLSGRLKAAALDNPVVSIATRYLGVRYQWGGATPRTGFDCSGLVQYVFAQLGIPLIHFAAAQWNSPYGVPVAPDRLRPGDLVFFVGSDGTRKAPGHVGIYIGDGYLIDAPHTGAKVRIDSLTNPQLARQYVGARRIVGPFLDDSRRLLAAKPNSSSTALPLGFGIPLQFGAAEDALGNGYARLTRVAAVGVPVGGSRSFSIWAAAILGGLLVLSAGGGFLVRRRRAQEIPVPAATNSTDSRAR